MDKVMTIADQLDIVYEQLKKDIIKKCEKGKIDFIDQAEFTIYSNDRPSKSEIAITGKRIFERVIDVQIKINQKQKSPS